MQKTQETRKARGEHGTRKQVRNADETNRERGENTGFDTKERLTKKTSEQDKGQENRHRQDVESDTWHMRILATK